MKIKLDSFNLARAEKALCVEALNRTGSIVGAAELLGITRHALKRCIVRHQIAWPLKREPSDRAILADAERADLIGFRILIDAGSVDRETALDILHTLSASAEQSTGSPLKITSSEPTPPGPKLFKSLQDKALRDVQSA